MGPSPKLSYRMEIYLRFFRSVFAAVGWFLVGLDRWTETQKGHAQLLRLQFASGDRPRIWFHAASVGELESLWPLVEFASSDDRYDLILTVFSTSAWSHVHRMARKLQSSRILFAGYSPFEGDWLEILQAVQPSLFVTAKYEAWPDMWNSFGILKIPLAIIGAKPRSSILWAKRILNLLAGIIPSIHFFTFDGENRAGLVRAFPQSEIKLSSDPRWDRVFQRSENQHARVKELSSTFSDLPRPWGVIGSAWASDLFELPREFSKQVSGTLWVVPHKTDAKSVSEIEILLRERGWTPCRTATDEHLRPAGKIAVLVDEMGFLAELYSVMNWAWVGGGFGSSIHSTIEPAVYGLPLLGGPNGREKFDEISLLQKQGQLRIVSREGGDSSMGKTLQRYLEGATSDSVGRWKTANQSHKGASRRIWDELAGILETETAKGLKKF